MQLDQITFTRFIAALTVVFFHYGNQVFPLNIPLLDNILKAGPIAVNYFYLLSGFIMAIAYYQANKPTQYIKDSNKKKFSALSYWWARFARIYPVYFLALLLIAVTKMSEANFGTAFFLNSTLLQSWFPDYALSLNSPGWSLSVEAFFYLCFPFLLAFVYRKGIHKLALIALTLWLSTQIIHTVLLNSDFYQPKNTWHNFIYYNPLMHLNAFILGFVVGVVFKDKKHTLASFTKISTPSILAVTSVIAAIIGFQKEITAFLGFEIALTNGLLAPLFLLVIVLLSLNNGFIARVFSFKGLVLLGEASFSMYILQRPIYGIYQRILLPRLDISETAHFYLYLALLIIISILSYKLFETPLRKLIRSINKPVGNNTARSVQNS